MACHHQAEGRAALLGAAPSLRLLRWPPNSRNRAAWPGLQLRGASRPPAPPRTPELLTCPRRAVQHPGQLAPDTGGGPGASNRRPPCHSERSAAMRREAEESRPDGNRRRSLGDAVWRGARGRRSPLWRDPSTCSARLHIARDDKVLLARTERCRNDESGLAHGSPAMATFPTVHGRMSGVLDSCAAPSLLRGRDSAVELGGGSDPSLRPGIPGRKPADGGASAGGRGSVPPSLPSASVLCSFSFSATHYGRGLNTVPLTGTWAQGSWRFGSSGASRAAGGPWR